MSEAGLDLAALEADPGVRWVVHDVVDSTMDAAGADAGPRPVLHVARAQRAGRGRRGRRWESPPGNLYATLAWPDPGEGIPPAVLGAVQVAWIEAIAGAGGPRCRVKWPNDGIVEGGKWAGVLAERGPGPNGPELRLGMGANLESAPVVDEPGPWPAVRLAEWWPAWPGATAVARLLLSAAIVVLEEGERGIEERLARWEAHDALDPAEPIVVAGPAGACRGRYAGVDPRGRLLVDTGDDTRAFVAGRIDHLRPA